jgi:hypothetical protein
MWLTTRKIPTHYRISTPEKLFAQAFGRLTLFSNGNEMFWSTSGLVASVNGHGSSHQVIPTKLTDSIDTIVQLLRLCGSGLIAFTNWTREPTGSTGNSDQGELIMSHLRGSAHGVDVDEQGDGTVTEPRMYPLIRQQEPLIDRRFEMKFLYSGVKAFSLTFDWYAA